MPIHTSILVPFNKNALLNGSLEDEIMLNRLHDNVYPWRQNKSYTYFHTHAP